MCVRMSTNICIYLYENCFWPFHSIYCYYSGEHGNIIVYYVLCIGVVAWELSYSSKKTSRRDSKMRSLCASSPDSAVQTDFETFKHSIVTLTLWKQRTTYCGVNEVKSPSSRQSRSTLALLTGCR